MKPMDLNTIPTEGRETSTLIGLSLFLSTANATTERKKKTTRVFKLNVQKKEKISMN